MNNELKEIGKQLKEILDKYPNRQKEILFYIFGEDTIRKLANKPTYEKLQKENELLKRGINATREYLQNELKDGRAEHDLWLMGCYDEDKIILEMLNVLLDKVGDSNE